MRFLLSSGSLWTYGLERCFALAAAVGFDGLELLVDQRWDTRQVDYVRGLIKRHRLPVLAVHSPFALQVPGWPTDQPRRLQRATALAAALEADVVVHHLPARIGYTWVQTPHRRIAFPLPHRPDAPYRRWLEQEYEVFCRRTAPKLAIENMPAYRRFGRRWNIWHWNTPEELRRFRHITLDTTHLGTWGLDPGLVFNQLAGRVTHIHLSNFDGQEHRPLKEGQLRLDQFLMQLKQAHYGGHVTLELEPDGLAAGQPDQQVLERLTENLDFCHRWTG
ncbi:MAG: sugar phosphate isomerase/epimerase [Candidatus Promineifilaceae bacterium]|nr:sugar phosphate isomerase/epimerase [Candidatus Promineifilaceae bacterium]